MKPRARTIQIFLPSGDPTGIQVAELTTGIVQVIEVPRKLVNDFLTMPQAEQVGVYFLVGEDSETGRPAVYVGQTGNVGRRINEHHLEGKHDFWSRALVAVSLKHSFTNTHALYLEWSSIAQANIAQRYKVLNGNAGSKPHTPAWLEADCEEFFQTIRMLLATLGQRFMDSLAPAVSASIALQQTMVVPSTEALVCSGKDGAAATGQYTDDGMVVLKGSKARLMVVPSFEGSAAHRRRAALEACGDLVQEGGFLVFQHDVEFGTPSGAADVVLGRSSNGWIEWTNGAGLTLDALVRQSKPGLEAGWKQEQPL
jgi:hypothetical protein